MFVTSAFSANGILAQDIKSVPAIAVPGTGLQMDWSIDGDSGFRKEKVQSLKVRFYQADSKAGAGQKVADLSKLQLKAFDARMPAHNHGMTTKPKISAIKAPTGAGRQFRVDGVMLHMPGDWVLQFDIGYGGNDKVVSVPVRIN